jgi:putative Mn2+ efflux pump MntP
MIAFALLGVVAGLDNLQVATAIAMTPLMRRRRVLFALAFVVCEIGASMLGAAGIRSLSFDVAPLVVAACGLAIIGFAFTERGVAPIVNSRWTIVLLPVSLSFDNLLLGAGAGAAGLAPLAAAATIGCVSASMALLGMAVGGRVRRWIPERIEIVSGVYLVAIAATMWLGKD